MAFLLFSPFLSRFFVCSLALLLVLSFTASLPFFFSPLSPSLLVFVFFLSTDKFAITSRPSLSCQTQFWSLHARRVCDSREGLYPMCADPSQNVRTVRSGARKSFLASPVRGKTTESKTEQDTVYESMEKDGGRGRSGARIYSDESKKVREIVTL